MFGGVRGKMYLCDRIHFKRLKGEGCMKTNTIAPQNPQLLVSVSDPSMLNKLRNAIKMMKGVSSISVLKHKKTGIEEAMDDIRQGRVTECKNAEDMFEKLGI